MYLLRAALATILLTAFAEKAFADNFTINANTDSNASAWVITGAGAVDAPAWQRGGEISLTSDAHEDGAFVTGGSLAQFDGIWYADLFFTLPANAAIPTLTFSGFKGDDKAVLMLNGVIVGDNGNSTFPGPTGDGLFAFAPGQADQTYDYTGVTSATITSDFILGGQNDLRLIVNNTHGSTTDIHAKTFQGSGDATDATLIAAITYSAPEPTSLFILTLCATPIFCRRTRQK